MNIQAHTRHPITLVMHDMVAIFAELGFSVVLERELEDVWHNFDALNVPKDHPARDMQDTFFIKGDHARVLRTHTSSVQIRFMERMVAEHRDPPFAIIAPGKVFRNEATDATHEMQFHQMEGLVVGERISVAELKWTLLEFFKKFLGPDAQIRLRPSFFPFVEPGFEVDVYTRGRWMELLGAGMVHPHVLKNVGLDPERYSGFAFGFGIDRMTMARYHIPDVRFFYQGDARINQW